MMMEAAGCLGRAAPAVASSSLRCSSSGRGLSAVPLRHAVPARRACARPRRMGDRLQCAAVASPERPAGTAAMSGGKTNPVQTPHSGYHDDSFPRRFFEGWRVGCSASGLPISCACAVSTPKRTSQDIPLHRARACEPHGSTTSLVGTDALFSCPQVLARDPAQGHGEPELCAHLLR